MRHRRVALRNAIWRENRASIRSWIAVEGESLRQAIEIIYISNCERTMVNGQLGFSHSRSKCWDAMVMCTGGDLWIHAGLLLEASGGLDASTVFGLLAAICLLGSTGERLFLPVYWCFAQCIWPKDQCILYPPHCSHQPRYGPTRSFNSRRNARLILLDKCAML